MENNITSEQKTTKIALLSLMFAIGTVVGFIARIILFKVQIYGGGQMWFVLSSLHSFLATYLGPVALTLAIIALVRNMQQLKKIDKMNRIRKKIAKFYDKKINIEKKIPLEDGCVYHLYWIYVKNREKFRKQMANIGIETGIHYNPIHKMSMYKQNRKLILHAEKN